MSGEERRQGIIAYLSQQNTPVSGTALAKEFGVSRQIIVQDIALLRSGNQKILSTNRGYMISDDKEERFSRIFKCRHEDEQANEELCAIVDQGGIVKDVFVNHKVYGRIQATMNIRSRRDVMEFMKDIHSGKSSLLKKVTSDYHYHTVLAESEEILNAIEQELNHLGYLIQPKTKGDFPC